MINFPKILYLPPRTFFFFLHFQSNNGISDVSGETNSNFIPATCFGQTSPTSGIKRVLQNDIFRISNLGGFVQILAMNYFKLHPVYR